MVLFDINSVKFRTIAEAVVILSSCFCAYLDKYNAVFCKTLLLLFSAGSGEGSVGEGQEVGKVVCVFRVFPSSSGDGLALYSDQSSQR